MESWLNDAWLGWPSFCSTRSARPTGTARPAVRPLRVAAIGGGTGLSTLLRGLCRHVPPPSTRATLRGQIQTYRPSSPLLTTAAPRAACAKISTCCLPATCATAWSRSARKATCWPSSSRTAFAPATGLEGHNFGNLFVAALTRSPATSAAIQLSSKILATRGNIYPVTTANATLVARMDDGLAGSRRNQNHRQPSRIAELILEPPRFGAPPETLEAIQRPT